MRILRITACFLIFGVAGFYIASSIGTSFKGHETSAKPALGGPSSSKSVAKTPSFPQLSQTAPIGLELAGKLKTSHPKEYTELAIHLSRSWGRTNPKEALEFAKSLPAPERAGFTMEILRGWAETDLSASWRALLILQKEGEMGHLGSLKEGARTLIDASTYPQSDEFIDTQYTQSAMNRSVKASVQEKKEGVGAALQALDGETGKQSILPLYLRSAIKRNPKDFEGLANTVITSVSDPIKQKELVWLLTTKAINPDQIETMEGWLEKHPDVIGADNSMEALAINSAKTDLNSASKLADKISDPVRRDATKAAILVGMSDGANLGSVATIFDSIGNGSNPEVKEKIAGGIVAGMTKEKASTFLALVTTLPPEAKARLR